MSLPSKLREFRKSLKKKNKNAQMFDDEQLCQMSRHMPVDMPSLRNILSENQADAFGQGILDITQAHTRNQTEFEECVLEIGAFVRGGMPGGDTFFPLSDIVS
jgi:hypothetical protein